ncbi:hypothetical protein PI125_g5598 [Phytophthora idaei]|nr:hypothetical protein PI125_g5598 [Phytophthora idaei]KAG3153760.1 hypothetical protein PI126_g9919 [Phytophthora idaei]
MPVEVVSKLEEYLDEQAAMTTSVMKDRLLSDLVVDVSISSIHCARHGQWIFDEEEDTRAIIDTYTLLRGAYTSAVQHALAT